MVQQDYTTILIKKATSARLRKVKVHPKQSYDEQINILLDKSKGKTKK